MSEFKNYICKTPVVIFIFNRPLQTELVLNAVAKAKPLKLYVISDGPRLLNSNDKLLVTQCQDLIKHVVWECEVITNFSEENLGCRKRINSGLDWVFSLTEEAIILEDDCLPNLDFFKFMEWGLSFYRENQGAGMISGSNLIDFKFQTEFRNGYSKYINIWGWATWRRVWESHDKLISLNDLKKYKTCINIRNNFNFWESLYWTEIFKNTINSGSTWDFQLQHTFFRINYFSVYPIKNLVENLGFGYDGTHTKNPPPVYIIKSKPSAESDLMQRESNPYIIVNYERDKYLIKMIWHYTPITAVRLWFTNLYRYLTI